jgi:hypothetical protein
VRTGHRLQHSLRVARKMSAWDDDFLASVLAAD